MTRPSPSGYARRRSTFFWPLTSLPLLAWRTLRWRTLRGGWLSPHLLRHRPFSLSRARKDSLIDVMVLVADHFEPSSRRGEQAAAESVRSWCAAYEKLAARHRDADGRPLQHTWFYRAEYPNTGCLQELSASCFRGYGEVEFHLHHGHDTHASFLGKLQDGLDYFNAAGAMLTAEARPRRRFAYVAGNWALDNGAGDDAMSGCNTELLALREAGCYADFTFPALRSPAQPRTTNAIYYATDTPAPKSYDTGVPVAASRPASGDLMIFQGPLVIDWRRGAFEDGALESYAPPAPDRLHSWLKANVHVAGRPEWVFVKLHTHGMQSRDTFLGPALEEALGEMMHRWGRDPFRLHFVTAREAYNIVKAAEAGHGGDPNQYRDFDVPPPANRRVHCTGRFHLLSHAPEGVSLEVCEDAPIRAQFAEGPLRFVAGRVQFLDAHFAGDEVESLILHGEGPVAVGVRGAVLRLEAGRGYTARELAAAVARGGGELAVTPLS